MQSEYFNYPDKMARNIIILKNALVHFNKGAFIHCKLLISYLSK